MAILLFLLATQSLLLPRMLCIVFWHFAIPFRVVVASAKNKGKLYLHSGFLGYTSVEDSPVVVFVDKKMGTEQGSPCCS